MTRIKLLIFFVLISFVGSACAKQEQATEPLVIKTQPPTATPSQAPIPTEKPIEIIVDTHVGQAINPLSGLYIDEEAAKRRPIGIMINNLKEALPQSGLLQADVIYETMVEGSITRLFAVYQDFDSTKIGPVRSARHYFLDFAFDFDAIYVHYGKSPQAYAAFSALDSDHMEGLSGLDSIMCFQDPERKRPHSTYTSFDGLMAAWEYMGYRLERDPEFDFKFQFSEEETVPSTQKAYKVTLPFSTYSTPWFEYDEQTKLYNRFEYDQEQIDRETGNQLTYTNIIIQLAEKWVIAGDKEGRLDMNLITSGTGFYVSKGAYIPITWTKKSHQKPTRYYLEDGSELKINAGKTWISVFPTNKAEALLFE